MTIGVPRETKDQEYRVGMTPDGVRPLRRGRPRGAGRARRRLGSGFPDDELTRRPARARVDARRPGRRPTCREGEGAEPRRGARACARGQMLFTYLHLAAEPDAHARAARRRRDRHRLRDDPAPGRHVPGARADERGGGAPRGADRRRRCSRRTAAARACCSAACRACRAGASRVIGARHRRHQRGARRARARRRGRRARHRSAPAHLPLRHLPRRAQHALSRTARTSSARW